MINSEQFHNYYLTLNLNGINAEEFLFRSFNMTMISLVERSKNNIKLYYSENLVLDYVIQEFKYYIIDHDAEEINSILKNEDFLHQFVSIVSDKVLFNEIIPNNDVSFVSHQSPIISTMELNINFIMDRIKAIKNEYHEKDVLLDMFRKAFLIFKCINYQLSSSFETEAFATWRTIHELECLIKIIEDHPEAIPTYYQHMVYNEAFRNSFTDKDEQQRTIDDLKNHMKEHDLKSKDMKKYIEYGWIYSIKDVEKNYPELKLNFRNGIESIAGLDQYSKDYEMASEVAHSSPILVYSNRLFFRYLTVVRSYESFLRLESLFYKQLQKYDKIDITSYIKMRNRYINLSKQVLNVESNQLKKYISSKKKSNLV